MLEITAALAKALVEEQFPEWSDLPVTPVEKDGHDNRSFHLGSEMLVRLPSAERYAAHVDIEVEWLPKLIPHLSLPIPLPIAKGRPSAQYPFP